MIDRRKGFILPVMILALTVLAIFIPLFIKYIQKESKDTMSEAKKSKALHLAEAGQDRGSWKLRESDAMWTNAVNGVTVANYDGSTEFTDVAGGRYKITYTAGPAAGEVTVTSKGKADNSTEVRTIKAVYSKNSVLGAMSVNGNLTYRPNMHVHWGPVVTYTSIDQSPSDYFPRKFSAGQIVGRDTVNDSNNGAMPSGDWVTYDYASFYNLGTPPTINLTQYRNLAKTSSVPLLRAGTGSSAGTQAAGETYSGRYTGDVKIEKASGSGDYSFTGSTSVIFIEGNVNRFPNGAWLDVKALCVIGNFDFNAGGTNYTATIPASASKEYQHSSLGFYYTGHGWTDGGTTVISDCGMHGFIYVGGDVSNAGGGATMCGAIYIVGTVNVNTVTVYYDSAVSSNILVQNAEITRQSWDEIISTW